MKAVAPPLIDSKSLSKLQQVQVVSATIAVGIYVIPLAPRGRPRANLGQLRHATVTVLLASIWPELLSSRRQPEARYRVRNGCCLAP